ncbi:unnamed protein product [Prunus armeniaca]|uniref:Uncharacterized protein n=1 Tax=Prunus armeniaca TaxID=36596 RepID=A0A6J5Y213_PRUAR|nr:unnamed protein product [Prunus armeniaca]CAB4320200.1 unnamed protein product [Prunus armeniaca]
MEIINATDPNTAENFNVRDMTMKMLKAIPDFLMERSARSCKLLSPSFTAHSLVSLACPSEARRNVLT